MKKLLCIILSACISASVLTACSAPEAEVSFDTETTAERSEATSEEEFDPFTVQLADKSTGEVNPRLVETLYPTDDVVIAEIIPTEDGYAVSNDGVGDSTAGIQKALNDCYAAGGGTVYLPAGSYAISGTITIPPFVTLRGDWQDADRGTDYGTVIFVYTETNEAWGKGKTVTEGTFMLGGSGGVVGMTVYYPRQRLDNVKAYPFTFYTDGKGANYMLSTIKNVTVLNGFRGIGACCLHPNSGGGAHEQLTVENFKGTFLYCGTEVYNQADVGTWQNITISNKYWKEARGDNIKAAANYALDAYTKQYTTGLRLGDLEWTEFKELSVSGCKIGIEIMPGKRIDFAGSLMDVDILDCTLGLKVSDIDSRWGMLIARGTIEGGINNRKLGVVKLCDVKVTGVKAGRIIEDSSDLSAYTVDHERSYVKPNARLYIAKLDKTGQTDVAEALQKRLNDAAATGGVVYVPAGRYRLDKPVTVPAGVELRGAASVAGRDQVGLSLGTVICCYYGDGAEANRETDAALITLAGKNAGVNGVRIIYPENGPLDSDLNTTYTVRGTAEGVYIVNSMISASAYGVDFSGCDNHFVKKVTTCCYYNSFRLGGKNGMMNGCLQNGTVIYRTDRSALQNWPDNEAQIWVELFHPITRVDNQYVVLQNADGQQVYNCFIYGCANMIVCNDSEAVVANIGSDNIGNGCAQTVCNGGELTVINAMRYNGVSYSKSGGVLRLYNRLTINHKDEETTVLQ